MSYRVRHVEHGVFQGEFAGLCFWWPDSEMPEQGLCEFPDEASAQSLIDDHFLMKALDSEMNQHLKREDFSIEPFDEKLNAKLLATPSPYKRA